MDKVLQWQYCALLKCRPKLIHSREWHLCRKETQREIFLFVFFHPIKVQ